MLNKGHSPRLRGVAAHPESLDRSLGLPARTLRALAEAGPDGIACDRLITVIFAGRPAVQNAGKTLNSVLTRLRQRGHPVRVVGGICRFGAEREALETVAQAALRHLTAAGKAGIPLTHLVDRIFSGRAAISHPRGAVRSAIGKLRGEGRSISIVDGTCRLGASPISFVEGDCRDRGRDEPLSRVQSRIVRALRDWAKLEPGGWMSTADIAAVIYPDDDADLSRQIRSISTMLKKIAGKGIAIEKTGFEATRAILYRLPKKT